MRKIHSRTCCHLIFFQIQRDIKTNYDASSPRVWGDNWLFHVENEMRKTSFWVSVVLKCRFHFRTKCVCVCVCVCFVLLYFKRYLNPEGNDDKRLVVIPLKIPPPPGTIGNTTEIVGLNIHFLQIYLVTKGRWPPNGLATIFYINGHAKS